MIRNVGFILLAAYLILVGLGVFGVAIPALIMGILAIASGIFILLGK